MDFVQEEICALGFVIWYQSASQTTYHQNTKGVVTGVRAAPQQVRERNISQLLLRHREHTGPLGSYL
jgi:hypothetical protein